MNITQSRLGVRSLPAVRLEHLWVVFALCLVGSYVSLTPTGPNDFWWHLKAGEIVATEGIPTTNRFAWTLPADHPFVYQSWLGEWLFYALYRVGGFSLVVFARNLLATAAFTLVAVEAQRRSGSWRLASLAVVLAAAMTMNNFATRTQNWSWVPFVLVFILLSRYADQRIAPRWLVGLPLIMVFWVNVHGGFIMGVIVAGAFVVGETLRRLLRQPRALPWQRLRWLYVACGAMVVATIANPLGVGVFGYLYDLLSDAPSQQLINEWQSPTPRSLAGGFFYLSILALVASFAFARRRPTITDVIVVCGLAWQAFIGVRYVVWFGMVATPIIAQSLAAQRTVFTLGATAASPTRRSGNTAANWVIAGLLLSVLVALQPWFKPLVPLPEPYQALFAPVPGATQLFTADTPVAATEHLREEPCTGRLFNELGYGSYLAWALYPQSQSFIDPRVELYPLQQWQDYVALTEGRDVAMHLDQYTIACVMLDTAHQPKLATAMQQLPGWSQSFASERSQVWRRDR